MSGIASGSTAHKHKIWIEKMRVKLYFIDLVENNRGKIHRFFLKMDACQSWVKPLSSLTGILVDTAPRSR